MKISIEKWHFFQNTYFCQRRTICNEYTQFFSVTCTSRTKICTPQVKIVSKKIENVLPKKTKTFLTYLSEIINFE